MILAPAAIVIARFFKSWGVLWFRLHAILMLFVVFVTILGLYFAYTSVGLAGGKHFDASRYPSTLIGLHVVY